MLALSGLSIAALGVLVALILYGIGWRLTSGRSIGVRLLVRGGLLLLIAVPVAGMLLLSPAMRGGGPDRAPQVSSPLQDELLREAERDVRRQVRPSDRLEDAAGGAAPPPPTTAKADEDTAWNLVPVFFGTDRQEQADPKRLQFNSERGRRLELGRAMVTVPKSHEVPNIERPWVVKIPYFDVTIYEEAEDPEKHFTMQEIKKLPEAEFLRLARERIAASNRYKDHALVFVHGYNTSFDHAVYRTAQIAYDLNFDGAAFLYSWPSGGAVASYTYDRESAQASEPYLRQFLDLVVKQTGAKSVSIIAHSMGNQPLLDVLKDMRSGGPETGSDQRGDPRRPRRRRGQLRQRRAAHRRHRQGCDPVCRLQRPGADRLAQFLAQSARRRRAGGGAADRAGHRDDRRHGGQHRQFRPQSFGLRREQRSVAGHR